VYNTYQQYLKNGYSKLQRDIQLANKEGFKLGIKLVRGAYIEQEKVLSKKFGYEYPINPTIGDTHTAYDSAVDLILSDIAKTDTLSVCIAGHNEDSVKNAYKLMKEKNIPLNTKRVYFAQLYGMCDHISLTLAKNGVNALKFVPYGPMQYVIPYLHRRMIENRGVIGKTQKERMLLKKEITRRLLPF